MTLQMLDKMAALFGSADMNIANSSLRHDLDIQELGFSTTVSELMKIFESPMQSTITFDLPITGRHTIRIVTKLSTPLYGTTFTVDTTSLDIRNSTDLELHIANLCQTSAQKYIVHENPAWHEVPGTADIVPTESGNGRQGGCRLAVMIEDELLALVQKTNAKTEVVAVWNGSSGKEGPAMLERVKDITAARLQNAGTTADE